MEEVRTSPPSILKLIAHETRWNVLQLLAVGDYRVQDLVHLLHVPQNLISYHMRLLRQAQVVIERPSTVDERSTYYSLDLERLHTLYQSAALDLHPAIAKEIDLGPRPPTIQGPSSLRVLFLCTENSSRSQMAEALLRHLSHGRIEVSSAGSQPGERIHPFAIKVLQAVGLDVQQQKPKDIESLRKRPGDTSQVISDPVLDPASS